MLTIHWILPHIKRTLVDPHKRAFTRVGRNYHCGENRAGGASRVMTSSSRFLVNQVRSQEYVREVGSCAGYIVRPFSKETVFTLELRRCDPSFPAFLPGS